MKKTQATYEELKIGDLVCHHLVVDSEKNEDLMLVLDILDAFYARCCPQSGPQFSFKLLINNLEIVRE